ncbi:MAG TPA: L-serine ammonia-lyase [Candidatus Acidoferrum sp.]|nr:L-serine ammonia-lyase [Candidatus Acidoferrum sp.]
MKTSLFEIFKIGIGPSSSHTVGPMRAAARFASGLRDRGLLGQVARVEANLYGSLALTGHGHGTDRAILLGLCGELPDRVEPQSIEAKLAAIRARKTLPLAGLRPLPFDESTDLLFHKDQALPFHSNGMRFCALDSKAAMVSAETYFSTGGGFIVREGEPPSAGAKPPVPYPFRSAAELLELGAKHDLAVWQIGLENEKAWHAESEVRAYVRNIWQTMQGSIERGLATEGILPGGLQVRRRAPRLAKKLGEPGSGDPLAPMDWVNVWAMAVNEENAAGGRIVTAPTNGAAGIVPAVAQYYVRYVPGADEAGLLRYFLTASVIGVLYKENASISGAEVGCQGEVGVACSMAAGGLVAAQNGANGQIEYAAEIGMEHNLGMTCDPIGGLVQIPCIERNAIGAVKAINASRIALREGSEHKVSLDQVIKTMYETGLDMQSRYKETSLGGLALNVIEC